MSSSIEFLNYILDELSSISNLTYKKMMGEYLLYVNGVLVGGIYDNRLLIKKTASNEKYLLTEEIPYNGAKTMWLIVDFDNKEVLNSQVLNVYYDLK